MADDKVKDDPGSSTSDSDAVKRSVLLRDISQ